VEVVQEVLEAQVPDQVRALGSAVVTPCLQYNRLFCRYVRWPPVKHVSGAGAIEDPMPRAVMANRRFARGVELNTVVQELPTVLVEPLSLPVKKGPRR